MKFPIRSLLLGCFAALMVVFNYSAPASASADMVIQFEDVRSSDLVLIEPADFALFEPDDWLPPVRSVAKLQPSHPLYELSWRTAGHSLSDYHLRC